jgi:hypothetical protein
MLTSPLYPIPITDTPRSPLLYKTQTQSKGSACVYKTALLLVEEGIVLNQKFPLSSPFIIYSPAYFPSSLGNRLSGTTVLSMLSRNSLGRPLFSHPIFSSPTLLLSGRHTLTRNTYFATVTTRPYNFFKFKSGYRRECHMRNQKGPIQQTCNTKHPIEKRIDIINPAVIENDNECITKSRQDSSSIALKQIDSS